MTYAEHRRIIDVDSHLFELENFLDLAARSEHRDLIRPMAEQKELRVVEAAIERGRELLAKRQSDPATMAKFEASLMDNRKSGWSRLGAFDPAERSHTLGSSVGSPPCGQTRGRRAKRANCLAQGQPCCCGRETPSRPRSQRHSGT